MTPTVTDRIFARLDREIWLITSHAGRKRAGLTATLVSQASIVSEGPRVFVGLSPQHHTTSVIETSQSFLMHLVDESHFDLVWKFGTQTGHDGDKFTEDLWGESPRGHPLLRSAVAWLECTVESQLETGDRFFFLGRVVESKILTDRPLLTLHQFRERLSPRQLAEVNARLSRDAFVDADLIRRWQDQGYTPIAIRS